MTTDLGIHDQLSLFELEKAAMRKRSARRHKAQKEGMARGPSNGIRWSSVEADDQPFLQPEFPIHCDLPPETLRPVGYERGGPEIKPWSLGRLTRRRLAHADRWHD